MKILKLFAYIEDGQRMSSKCQLTMYYDTCNTSFFGLKLAH